MWAVTSGPAWCMKFNRRSGRLAVGTEEGYVCLYTVVDDGLDFVKVLDKQEGRIFCLDWHTGFVTFSIFFCLLFAIDHRFAQRANQRPQRERYDFVLFYFYQQLNLSRPQLRLLKVILS